MNSDAPFIDFHTHSEWNGDGVIEVVSVDGNKPKRVTLYTIGFHPWWVNGPLSESNLLLIRNRYLDDKNCLGIGECGLDNLKGASIEIQESAFIQQINVANELKAPVIIHCVRAFERVLTIKKQFGTTPWAIHGFVRNKVLAKQLLDEGFYISVAPYLNMPVSFIETLRYLPIDKLFIETDSDFKLDIRERYQILSHLKNISAIELKDQLLSNLIKFYSQKWKHLNG